MPHRHGCSPSICDLLLILCRLYEQSIMLSEDFKNMYIEQLTFWSYQILLGNELPRALNWMEFHLASEYNEPI